MHGSKRAPHNIVVGLWSQSNDSPITPRKKVAAICNKLHSKAETIALLMSGRSFVYTKRKMHAIKKLLVLSKFIHIVPMANYWNQRKILFIMYYCLLKSVMNNLLHLIHAKSEI